MRRFPDGFLWGGFAGESGETGRSPAAGERVRAAFRAGLQPEVVA